MRPPAGIASTRGPVLIIGTGLIGGSIGLGLATRGVEVYLRDASPTALALARDLGVGRIYEPDLPPPALVVVATPPDVAGATVVAALQEFGQAIVCDVASVKAAVFDDILDADPQLTARYCGAHPMAGREVNGVGAASADLFKGRPWVVVPHAHSQAEAELAVRNLGVDLGGVISQFEAADHDRAVALVSHVPQLISSLLAGRLVDAPVDALGLAGGGLRDTTRIASSDPRLWNAILAGNAGPVTEILRAFRQDLDELVESLEKAATGGPLVSGSVGMVNQVMTRGNEGVERIPGKHGTGASQYGRVNVLVPDEPGQLGRLFADAGQAQVNIEDIRLEHSLGQPQGMASLYVIPAQVEPLREYLQGRGWSLVSQ